MLLVFSAEIRAECSPWSVFLTVLNHYTLSCFRRYSVFCSGEAIVNVDERTHAVSKFNAEPAHRRLYQTVLAIVFMAVTACVAFVGLLPTKYCNYLIPVVLGISLVLLMLVARRYVRLVTEMVQRHSLVCEHCGCATIARPDEISLRTSDRTFGIEVCYNCDTN